MNDSADCTPFVLRDAMEDALRRYATRARPPDPEPSLHDRERLERARLALRARNPALDALVAAARFKVPGAQ